MEPFDILTQLAECWCAQLALSIGGAPATCCVVTNSPVIPSCCDGFGWVRMLSITPVYPSNKNGAGPSRCAHPMWSMAVELGVSRCAPPVCGDGMANPCCDNELSASNVQFGDFKAWTLALGCCLVATNPDPYADSIGRDQVTMGVWSVADPEGACVTATGTAAIQFSMFCDCPA